jgi:hypothetical protein
VVVHTVISAATPSFLDGSAFSGPEIIISAAAAQDVGRFSSCKEIVSTHAQDALTSRTAIESFAGVRSSHRRVTIGESNTSYSDDHHRRNSDRHQLALHVMLLPDRWDEYFYKYSPPPSLGSRGRDRDQQLSC